MGLLRISRKKKNNEKRTLAKNQPVSAKWRSNISNLVLQ